MAAYGRLKVVNRGGRITKYQPRSRRRPKRTASLVWFISFLLLDSVSFLSVSQVQLKQDVQPLILLGRRPILRNRFVYWLLGLFHRYRAGEQNVVFQVNVLVKIGFKIRQRLVQRLVADTRIAWS